jgi:hypothetical protein
MNILELFAGSRSIGKIAEKRGHNVFSVDKESFDNIDLCIDIDKLRPEDIPFIPDMIWASPPCTTFSLAAISHHREIGTRKPKTKDAIKADKLVINTLNIIKHFKDSIFYIENPRATLHKMHYMKGVSYTVVWYCKYGDIRAKPTTIFSNNIRNLFNPKGWESRPQCWNNNKKCHHEEAPRGSTTGTQGLKNNYERSKIPEELCIEIIKATENKYNK